MQDLHRQFLAYLLTYPQGFAQLLSEKGACVTGLPSRPHRHSDPRQRILVHVDSDTY